MSARLGGFIAGQNINASIGTVTFANTPDLTFGSAAGTPAVGQPVTFITTGTLPTGFSLSTIYYVRSVSSNTCQVSTTQGGSATTYTNGTGSGTHTAVTQRAFNPYAGAPDTVEYLVVAGGGGGGATAFYNGGGGGAGGLLAASNFVVAAGTALTVTVGAGGAGGNGGNGSQGSSSVFSSISTTGGGYGAGGSAAGGSGGSGGGGGVNTAGVGGAGTAGQGNNGGNGSDGGVFPAGGGGGSGSVGDISPVNNTIGGAGICF